MPAPRRKNSHARGGKIARLPHDIRENVCQRLFSGEKPAGILAVLNADPRVIAHMKEYAHIFRNPVINSSNLREWRLGGFQDWRQRNAPRLEPIRRAAQKPVRAITHDGLPAINLER